MTEHSEDVTQSVELNSSTVKTTQRILLGQYVQDDVGTQWLAIQRIEHYKEPGVFRLVLKEHCLENRGPRAAIVREDGAQFQCQHSPATCVVSILELKGGGTC
jgi:hypothetical protein